MLDNLEERISHDLESDFPKEGLGSKPKEISKAYGWPDLPKDGGGDIDLWDYSLE